MTTHLRVLAGVHQLLLPGSSVRHVAEERSDDGAALDLSQVLGAEQPGSVVILYGEEEAAEIRLAVDQVIGLVNVPEQMLARLPPLSPRFAQLFDSIAIEPIDGHHPLCLRARIAPEHL